MEAEVYVATQFVAAAVNFVLGIMLLVIRFQSRINRAFAVVMLFTGVSILALALSHLATASGNDVWHEKWLTYRTHILLGLGPALAYFYVAYRNRGHARGGRWTTASLVAFALLIQWIYLGDRCAVECVVGNTREMGILGLIAFTTPLVTGLVALALVAGSTRRPAAPAESATLIVGTALALWAVLDAGLASLQVLKMQAAGDFVRIYGTTEWGMPAMILKALGVVPALVALGMVMTACARVPAVSHRSRNAAIATGLAVLTVLLTAFVLPEENPQPLHATFLYGLWRLAVPVAVVYALVRHRLFDIDVQLKRGIVQSTIVLTFLALFFSVSKIAENYFSENESLLVGGVTAGLALLALSPLEKLGRRVADMLMPHAAPVAKMPEPQRIELFREQTRLIWSDGMMGRKERLVLDQLRDRLGIPHETANRIEHEEASRGQSKA